MEILEVSKHHMGRSSDTPVGRAWAGFPGVAVEGFWHPRSGCYTGCFPEAVAVVMFYQSDMEWCLAVLFFFFWLWWMCCSGQSSTDSIQNPISLSENIYYPFLLK